MNTPHLLDQPILSILVGVETMHAAPGGAPLGNLFGGGRVRHVVNSETATELRGPVGTDLLVIGADQDETSLKQAWFYVPRMLQDNSIVVIEDLTGPQPDFRVVAPETIDQFAGSNASGCRAA